MQDVTVKRIDLLEKLQANRKAHRAVFEASLEGYKKAIVGMLETMLAEAKAGNRVSHHVNLPIPMDQTREYDQAILMLEMSVESEVELTSSEFSCYVMDRWNWKNQFSASNKTYFESAFHTEGDLPAGYAQALSTE